MGFRSFGLSATVACMVFASVGWSAESPDAKRPAVVAPTSENWKVGARCRVELYPMQIGRDITVTVYEGVVTRLSDDGVGLNVSRRSQHVAKKMPFHRTPFLERLLGRNVGVGSSTAPNGKDVWLRQMQIYSVKVIVDETAAPGAETDVPRIRANTINDPE